MFWPTITEELSMTSMLQHSKSKNFQETPRATLPVVKIGSDNGDLISTIHDMDTRHGKNLKRKFIE